MHQKEAVFAAVTSVKKSKEFEGIVSLSKEERDTAVKQIFQEFKAGNVGFRGEMPEDKKLMTYVSGLISNWLRKDSRLNGNTVYIPKNAGSRTGNGDDALKAMRSLLASTSDPKDRTQIETAIAQRVQELKPKREININALPEKLRHLAQQQ